MKRINDNPSASVRYQFLMAKERHKQSSGKSWGDKTGMMISALCFLHCWSMPLILLVFPELLQGEAFVHPVLGGLAIFAALLFVRNHSHTTYQIFIWLALAAGLFMILLPLLLPHAYLSHAGEITLNTAGSFLLIFVHYSNYRSCKHIKG